MRTRPFAVLALLGVAWVGAGCAQPDTATTRPSPAMSPAAMPAPPPAAALQYVFAELPGAP